MQQAHGWGSDSLDNDDDDEEEEEEETAARRSNMSEDGPDEPDYAQWFVETELQEDGTLGMPAWDGPEGGGGGGSVRQGRLRDSRHSRHSRQLEALRKCNNSGGGAIVDLWLTAFTANGSYNGPAKGYDGVYGDKVLKNRAVLLINNHTRGARGARAMASSKTTDGSTTSSANSTAMATPLFLFVATAGLHVPVKAPPSYDRRANNDFGRMTVFADDTLGSLRKALESQNMWRNTLLVVVSDNGAVAAEVAPKGSPQTNRPFRGGKFSDLEGGVRSFAFISGGAVPLSARGSTVWGYMHIADWFTTFSRLAGVDPRDTKGEGLGHAPVEQYDMWPMLIGANKTSPRTEIVLSGASLMYVCMCVFARGCM